ncbi:hypothetical protein [Pseudoclavibacter albus]|uniref:hypothetical protein n=1 Tax=Pseudoclavibacter albus TaxID=272241 RepID=UPI00082417DE|nr:hypothetical protein [Pseudoclavibacter alba]
MINRKRMALIAASAAFALALSGCSGKADDSQSAANGTPAPDPVTEVQDMPGTASNYEGAATDVKTEQCERAGDVWKIGGTVTNSAEASREYRIYVSLLSDTDTRALQQVDVKAIEAGASEKWSTEIPLAEDNLKCVLRVERFEPGAAGEGDKPADGEETPAEETPAEGDNQG